MCLSFLLVALPNWGVMNAEMNAGAMPRFTSGVWNQTSARPITSQLEDRWWITLTNSNVRCEDNSNSSTEGRSVEQCDDRLGERGHCGKKLGTFQIEAGLRT